MKTTENISESGIEEKINRVEKTLIDHFHAYNDYGPAC